MIFQKNIKRFFGIAGIMMGCLFASHLYADDNIIPSSVTVTIANNPINNLNVNPQQDNNPNVVQSPDPKIVVQNICGNGIVEPSNGEECDGGADCDANCKKIPIDPPPAPPAELSGDQPSMPVSSDNADTSTSSGGGCDLGVNASGSFGNILMLFSLFGTLLIRRIRK